MQGNVRVITIKSNLNDESHFRRDKIDGNVLRRHKEKRANNEDKQIRKRHVNPFFFERVLSVQKHVDFGSYFVTILSSAKRRDFKKILLVILFLYS